eukprot:6308085-Amphidinium_carterae.1
MILLKPCIRWGQWSEAMICIQIDVVKFLCIQIDNPDVCGQVSIVEKSYVIFGSVQKPSCLKQVWQTL